MATYLIGDVQGCHDTLLRLIQRIGFDAARDRLWFAGDLVNRGPRSLDVLHYVRDLGDRATVVLGNHDLWLLAVAEGVGQLREGVDTFGDVLGAPDRDELIEWVRTRPVLHREGDTVLVHAGLHPGWSVEEAADRARRVETTLRGPGRRELLRRRKPSITSPEEATTPEEQMAFSLGVFISIRTCTPEGRLCLDHKGPPRSAPSGCVPWFDVPGRRSRDVTVAFGHWSTLGLHLRPDLIAVDTGCVWGGSLTAVRLEDRKVFQEPCAGTPDARPVEG
jgi:bis(5'-nucleosyl)-tetraphosphatase (symmetrical)